MWNRAITQCRCKIDWFCLACLVWFLGITPVHDLHVPLNVTIPCLNSGMTVTFHSIFPEEEACNLCDLFVFLTRSKKESWIYAQRMCFAAFILGGACLHHGRSRGETSIICPWMQDTSFQGTSIPPSPLLPTMTSTHLPCLHAVYTDPSSLPTTKLLTSLLGNVMDVTATALDCLCCSSILSCLCLWKQWGKMRNSQQCTFFEFITFKHLGSVNIFKQISKLMGTSKSYFIKAHS